MLVFCDIDGSLADCEPAVEKYLASPPKRWDEFYSTVGEFEPIRPVLSVVDAIYAHGDTVVFGTGRRGSPEVEMATKRWLSKYSRVTHYSLVMRPPGDHRPAFKLKMQWISDLRPDLIIDDEPETVSAAREAGFIVLQVHGFRKLTPGSDMVSEVKS